MSRARRMTVGEPVEITPESLLPYAHPRYRPPRPQDVRAVARMARLSGSALAKLVGVKDGRVVRAWLADNDVKTTRNIRYAAWRLLLLKAGLVTTVDGVELDEVTRIG